MVENPEPIEPDASAWTSPASFWFPEHVVESAWLTHGPFAAWLMDAQRPRTFVELGTHNGYSYFAFLEAAARLHHELHAWAVDSWEGDEHAGFYGDDIYRQVSEVNERYAHSTLIRSYFSDAVSDFEDGSIDLLHIDGRHRYEDAREDYETYRPKLSDRSIVLFHDIAETGNGFGVHRLWDELATEHPSFAFEHGHGLGVLLTGDDQTPAILRFIEAAATDPERIREDYARLGGRIEGVQVHAQMLGVALNDIAVLRASVDQLRLELDLLRRSRSWRITAPLRRISSGRTTPVL